MDSTSISKSIFSYLPLDIIKEILLYDKHFVRRNNNRIVCINEIIKDDIRYQLLNTRPKVYEMCTNSWSVILGKNKRYIIKHYLRPSLIWEYSFYIYSKDKHTNMMCSIPDSIICIPLYNESYY